MNRSNELAGGNNEGNRDKVEIKLTTVAPDDWRKVQELMIEEGLEALGYPDNERTRSIVREYPSLQEFPIRTDLEGESSKDEEELQMLFARDGERLVGKIKVILGEAHSVGHKRNEAGIYSVFVSQRYRLLGIARKLMVEVIKLIKKRKDIVAVRLSVAASNEGARKLYADLGFTEVSRQRNAFVKRGGSGELTDKINMRLDLKNGKSN